LLLVERGGSLFTTGAAIVLDSCRYVTTLQMEAVMGFFDEMMNSVGSQLGGTSRGGLMEQVLGLINNPESGGLGGLIDTFKSKGLGDAISSWISTEENQPVTAEQITNTLGTDTIQKLAQKLGIPDTEVSRNLAALLPQVIDKLTPNGIVPEGGLLEQGLSLLKQKLLG
jgi:uncharacterized protein YidB (DUF937 family)